MQTTSMNLFYSLTLIFLLPYYARSAEVSAQPVEITELIQQAMVVSPERQAYLAALAAESEIVSAVGTNRDPVLSLEVGRKQLSDMSGASIDKGEVWTASLSQTFEWPERLRLQRAVAERQVESAKLKLDRFEQAVEVKIALLVYRISRAQLRAQGSEEMAMRLKSVREALLAREPSGIIPATELSRIEAAEVVARRRADEAQLVLKQMQMEMNQLRGVPSLAPLVVATPKLDLREAPDLGVLLASARDQNFNYRIQVVDSERSNLESDLARSDSVPGYTAGPFISQDRVGGRETIIGLRFDIPLPITSRSSSAERVGLERRRQFKAELAAAWWDIEREIGQAWIAYTSKVEQLRLQKDDGALRFADAARQAELHYREGALSMQFFMEAQASYLEAIDATLLLQEQAVEVGFRLRELSGTGFTPILIR